MQLLLLNATATPKRWKLIVMMIPAAKTNRRLDIMKLRKKTLMHWQRQLRRPFMLRLDGNTSTLLEDCCDQYSSNKLVHDGCTLIFGIFQWMWKWMMMCQMSEWVSQISHIDYYLKMTTLELTNPKAYQKCTKSVQKVYKKRTKRGQFTRLNNFF